MKFPAIAFDLDGTLYPNYRLYFRLLPFMISEYHLLRAMGTARTQLRNSATLADPKLRTEGSPLADNSGGSGDFYENQARIMAEVLGEPVEKVMEKNERLIYRGWEPHFKKIRLFPHVRETLEAFRDAGIKLGLLSDFPPEIKLENLKVLEFWDVIVCSERVGQLKPHSASFLELAFQMKTPPEQILYVGNSVSYDVTGAQKAGMKAALIQTGWGRIRKHARIGGSAGAAADFCFSDYRQLRDYVLS